MKQEEKTECIVSSILTSILSSVFEECAVCYECTLPSEKLSCGHRIHMDCIYKSKSTKCPLCRKQLQLTRKQNSLFEQDNSQYVYTYEFYYIGLYPHRENLELLHGSKELENAYSILASENNAYTILTS